MAKLISKNFSFKQPIFKDGEIIEGANLSQTTPNTKIADGVKSLTFKSCNLRNCKVPNDATVIDCNTFQGVIPPEPPNDPDQEAKNIIFNLGNDKFLDLIGKEAAKARFNLKDV